MTVNLTFCQHRFRSRRPPTFEQSASQGEPSRQRFERNPTAEEVKSLPVRKTVGGTSERIQVNTSKFG